MPQSSISGLRFKNVKNESQELLSILKQYLRSTRNIVKAVAVLSLLSGLIFSIGACDTTGYKVLSVKEGIRGFSFEYPNNYSLISLDLENTPTNQYSQAGLSSNDGDNYSEIYLYLWVPSAGSSSADQIMDKLVENASTGLQEFSLVSDDTVMLGDTVTRQVMFTADSDNSDNAGQSDHRIATYRLTTMIFSGLAVEIDMTCDQSITDTTLGHYQHVLDTFSVID